MACGERCSECRVEDACGVSSDESDVEVDDYVVIQESVGTTPDRGHDEHTGGEGVCDDEVAQVVSDDVEGEIDVVMPQRTENEVDEVVVDDNVVDDIDDVSDDVSEGARETCDDVEDDVESKEEDDEVPLRRSGRATRRPDFYQAGVNQVNCNGEWKEKCEYLVRCMRDFPQCQAVFANAIAKIVTES